MLSVLNLTLFVCGCGRHWICVDWCEVWNQSDTRAGTTDDHCSNLYNFDELNAIINSAVQLGWTAVNSQGAVNKQGVDMRKDAGKIKRKTSVMCTMFDTQLMDQSRHDWRRRESTYVDKTRTIIEKKWPHYISPRFGQTGSISATWISGRSEKPSCWQNKRVWMGKAGGGRGRRGANVSYQLKFWLSICQLSLKWLLLINWRPKTSPRAVSFSPIFLRGCT